MPDEGSAARVERSRRVDLVLEGGGVKGIGLVGALATLEEHGFQPQNVAGTSAGAIVATALAAGYTAAEQRDILASLDFNQFTDKGWEDRIPVVGTPLSILLDQGIYEGEAFLKWMRDVLEAKGVRTFADLVHPEYADQPQYRYKVQVIASDITARRMLVLPRDAVHLGIEPDQLGVALAVRMSMSIPIFFEPVRLRNPATGEEHLIVDGGMLSNFPVWLFDSPGEPDWPTLGLRLVEPEPKVPLAERLARSATPRGGLAMVVDFIKSLVQTMMEAHDRLYIENSDFVRTIPIPTLGVASTDFDLSRERAMALHEAGRGAASSFLETWDFERYIAEFRRGDRHHRRMETLERASQSAAPAS